MRTRVAGHDYEIDRADVERGLAGVDPEPIREHYIVVGGRRFPPKQVLAIVTGLDRGDFTTHQARSVLRRLGFGAYRRVHRRAADTGREPRAEPASPGPETVTGASALAPFAGRWVAQEGDEILYDAGSPEAVLRWLRRHARRARVWQVPDSPRAAGSMLSAP